MNARLASGLFISALLRDVHARGGTGVIVVRGDTTGGAVLIICREKSQLVSLSEQRLGPRGRYVWAPLPLEDDVSEAELNKICQRRRQIDPDLWIIELDIANVQRFIAEMSGED